jgi:uncharacterized protein YjbJ (UPF0337 family)
MLNKDMLLGKWADVKVELKKKWDLLKDEELEKAKGNVNLLVTLLQSKLGISKEEAMKRLETVLTQSALRGLEIKGNIEVKAKKTMETANFIVDEVKSKIKK